MVEYIILGTGLAMGIFFTYTVLKLQFLNEKMENLIDSFPTPEEMAKEVLKVKLPVRDLPEGLLDGMKKEADLFKKLKEMSEGKSEDKTSKNKNLKELKNGASRSTYIG